MSDELSRIRQEIRNELDSTGRVAIEHWLAEYPDYRAELEAFIGSLGADITPDLAEPASWPDGGAMVRRLIAESTARFIEERKERRLGKRRSAFSPVVGVHVNPVIVRPRVYADLVHRLSALTEEAVDLVKLAKAAHVEIRYFGLQGFKFVPAAKGPLDDDFYRALGVAKREGWIEPAGKHHLRPGPRIAEVEDEVSEYLRDPELADQLARVLAPYSGWELGVWTTVLWTSEKLVERGEPIGLASVKRGILEEPKWKVGKIEWREFSDVSIVDALGHLSRLRLIPPVTVDPE